jgi:hypothetical protein
MSDFVEKGAQHPNLNAQKVEGCSIARPCWNRRNGQPKCLHRFPMLREAIDELVDRAISRDSDNSIVII